MGLLLQEGLKSRGCGVGNEDVQRTKSLAYLREQAAYGCCFPELGLDDKDTPSQGGDGGSGLLGCNSLAAVVHHHVSALPRQTQRNGSANAARATGDQGHMTGKSHVDLLPFQLSRCGTCCGSNR